MALYLVFKSNAEMQWHINQRLADFEPREVIEVQADGDELEYIRANFDNLPIPNTKRVVNWYGDLAALVASILPQKPKRF